MTITITIDEKRDLTLFTAEGELTFREQMTALRKFYRGNPSANVIWDFRKIAGNRISSQELQKIISFIKQHESKRPLGRTALIAATDLDFGLSRMGQTYADVEDLSWEMEAFRSLAPALRWIKAGTLKNEE